MTEQNIKKVSNRKHIQQSVEVKPKTDSFIQVVSNINPWLLGLGFISLVIGFTVIAILLAKLTPLGKVITKSWNGLLAMFKALIAWKPKGDK